MVTEWVVETEREMEVDRRHLRMQSMQAIRSVVDALVELITNSDDAYRANGDDKSGILVAVTRRRKAGSCEIIVKDRAGGMSKEDMEQKILKYGAFSAAEKSRGFMGRGAKDIAALGPASFESIRSGKYSCVDISPEFRTRTMKPIPAREEHYKDFGVKPGKGGLKVSLEVNKSYTIPRHDSLCRDLQRHYALRDIVRHREIKVADTNSGEQASLRYMPPEGHLVVDKTHSFPAPYEAATAKLQIFLATKELPSELQEGVLVCDDHAIHQVTRFSVDLDQDSVAHRFFGRLECPYIRALQMEFEEYRKAGKVPPKQNPTDIVDPNRRRGLDRDGHPFVSSLFDWAENLLREEVEKVRREEAGSGREIANQETKRRLKELSRAVAEHLKERLDEETLVPRSAEELAALNREGVLLNPQFGRLAVGEKRRLGYTVVSLGQVEDPAAVTIKVDSDAIRVTPLKPALKPQRRNPDRLTAYFEVEGVKQVERVNLTVRHSSELIAPIARTLQVVEAEDPYAQHPYGISFEKHNYTVHDNGTRTLIFVAKGRRFRCVVWNSKNLVESSNPEAVAILRGNQIEVGQAARDVWKGEIHVRGRGVGKQGTITLCVNSHDGLERTNTSVEVVGKEESPDVSYRIEIVPEESGRWRAVWDKSNPYHLKIFGKHPVLARYLGREEDAYPGQEKAHCKVLLAEIVAEKVVEKVLENRLVTNPKLLEEPNAFFFHHAEGMTTFLPIAHQIMIGDGEVKGLAAK